MRSISFAAQAMSDARYTREEFAETDPFYVFGKPRLILSRREPNRLPYLEVLLEVLLQCCLKAMKNSQARHLLCPKAVQRGIKGAAARSSGTRNESSRTQ